MSNQVELATPTLKPTRSPYLEILSDPHYRNLWIGGIISQLGDRFHSVAVMVMIYNLTGSAAAVGTQMMLTVGATWLFGLWAGVYIDRSDRKTIMVTSDLVRCLLALLIPACYWLWPGQHVWPIYLTSFCLAAVSTFFGPAKSATIPNLVKKEHLLHANSLSQMTFMFTMTIGMALGGLLVKILGTAPAFFINAVSFALSAAFISTLPSMKPAHHSGTRPKMLAEVRDGLVYIKDRPAIVFILSLIGSVILVTGATNVLFMPFVKEVMGLAPEDSSFFQVSSSIGMFIGTAIITKLMGRWQKRAVLVGSLQINAMALLVLLSYPKIWLGFLMMFVNGVSNAAINIPITTTLQEQVEDQVRGRVFSLFDMILNSASIISMAPAGYLADRYGVLPVLTVACVGLILIGFLARFTKGYRQLV